MTCIFVIDRPSFLSGEYVGTLIHILYTNFSLSFKILNFFGFDPRLFLGPVYTIPDSYLYATIFLSDRGYHLHHAKAIRLETFHKLEGKSLRSVGDTKVTPYCCKATRYSVNDRPN